MRQYEIVGRKKPTATVAQPKLFRMKIFAPNEVVAKSRFWYFVGRTNKLKRTVAEVLSLHEVFEAKPLKVKNFGVWIRYNSRSGVHNSYKEFRDVTATGAIEQMYLDMAARHRARKSSIHVVKIEEVKSKDCRREIVTRFHDPKLKFPLPHRIQKPEIAYRKTFLASRPHTTTF